MTAPDEIIVAGLELMAHIGVPEAERATPQRLTLWLVMEPAASFGALGEDIRRTVDYAEVCNRVRNLVSGRPWVLIETLVSEIADAILREFACVQVRAELRKFVLADTEYVAARLTRRRSLDPLSQ
jgi:dihydroneopterin aldolase